MLTDVCEFILYKIFIFNCAKKSKLYSAILQMTSSYDVFLDDECATENIHNGCNLK